MALTEKQKKSEASRYEKLKASGICASCKKAPIATGTVCSPCILKRKETTRKRKEARLAASLCRRCGQKPASIGQRCEDCAKRDNAREVEQRKVNKSKGLCVTCQTPVEGKSECEPCRVKSRAYAKDYYDDRSEKALCVYCSKPSGDFVTCEDCRKEEKVRRIKIKQQVMDHYGGKCACCPEIVTTLDFLTIDHINGDGAAHRREFGGKFSGEFFYRWLIREGYPGGFQVLCWNCNCSKRMNNNVCWHNLPR